jgi:hypothetical protein
MAKICAAAQEHRKTTYPYSLQTMLVENGYMKSVNCSRTKLDNIPDTVRYALPL